MSYDKQAADYKGSRFRKTINGWSNKDINGKKLRISDLNGNLTKVAAYRGTICSVQDELFDYLLRRINGEDLPEVIQAKENKKQIITSIESLLKFLH